MAQYAPKSNTFEKSFRDAPHTVNAYAQRTVGAISDAVRANRRSSKKRGSVKKSSYNRNKAMSYKEIHGKQKKVKKTAMMGHGRRARRATPLSRGNTPHQSWASHSTTEQHFVSRGSDLRRPSGREASYSSKPDRRSRTATKQLPNKDKFQHPATKYTNRGRVLKSRYSAEHAKRVDRMVKEQGHANSTQGVKRLVGRARKAGKEAYNQQHLKQYPESFRLRAAMVASQRVFDDHNADKIQNRKFDLQDTYGRKEGTKFLRRVKAAQKKGAGTARKVYERRERRGKILKTNNPGKVYKSMKRTKPGKTRANTPDYTRHDDSYYGSKKDMNRIYDENWDEGRKRYTSGGKQVQRKGGRYPAKTGTRAAIKKSALKPRKGKGKAKPTGRYDVALRSDTGRAEESGWINVTGKGRIGSAYGNVDRVKSKFMRDDGGMLYNPSGKRHGPALGNRNMLHGKLSGKRAAVKKSAPTVRRRLGARKHKADTRSRGEHSEVRHEMGSRGYESEYKPSGKKNRAWQSMPGNLKRTSKRGAVKKNVPKKGAKVYEGGTTNKPTTRKVSGKRAPINKSMHKSGMPLADPKFWKGSY